jgi:hypothetical protein
MLSKLADNEVNLLLNSYKNPIILKDNWILVNKNEYNKNKNKIILTNANIYSYKQILKDNDFQEYQNNQILIKAETKNKYISIRYNGNFVAISISDTEYGIVINPMKLISAKNITLEDKLGVNNKPPKFTYLLNLLGWKITRKALNNIKNQDDYF